MKASADGATDVAGYRQLQARRHVWGGGPRHMPSASCNATYLGKVKGLFYQLQAVVDHVEPGGEAAELVAGGDIHAHTLQVVNHHLAVAVSRRLSDIG